MRFFPRILLYPAALAVCVGLLSAAGAQLHDEKEIWNRVDSLEAAGLYRTAYELTGSIYDRARKDADIQNEVRSLIYRLKYIQVLEEDGHEAAIGALVKELPDPRPVVESIKYTLLAELYYRYYTANRWQISQNPPHAAVSGEPLHDWSPEAFYTVILDDYRRSMNRTDTLLLVRVSSLPGLWTGNLADTVSKPRLYDVMMSRYLDFLDHASEFAIPVYRPDALCLKDGFGLPESFTGWARGIPLSDDNPWLLALKGYGLWLDLSTSAIRPVIDLRRLQYMFRESCRDDRDSLYDAALTARAGQLAADSLSAMFYEALALHHADRGSRFRINDPDTAKYAGENRIAVTWMDKALSWPVSLSGKRCLNLKRSLLRPDLTVQTGSYEVPGQPFPVSLEYRNLHRLSYRLLRMGAADYYAFRNRPEEQDLRGRIGRMKPVRSGVLTLPDNGDLNPHRTSMILDPLSAGFYLMVFDSDEPGSATNACSVYVPVTVTGTTLINQANGTGSRLFFFRDRSTGAPLEGLTVIPWYQLMDSRSGDPLLEKGSRLSSGKEGFLEIPDGGPGRDDPSPRPYRLQVINGTDTLLTSDIFYPAGHSGKPGVQIRVLIYTDRSLYRPGQIARFRGVMLDYYGDSVSIHRGDSLTVSLQDPKYQLVDKLTLGPDSLGVFTGSFPLPYKGLTGNYILQTPYGGATVKMEPFRRPAFSVELVRPHKVYRPGDRVELPGRAMALSGEPVAGAEVVAEIRLQAISRFGKWSPVATQSLPFAQDTAKTGVSGEFTCRWKTLESGANPFGTRGALRYAVKIRITDLNGETHEEETRIDVGDGTANLLLDIPSSLSIGDTLAGQTAALGTDGRILAIPSHLRISKLRDPAGIWLQPVVPVPDRFIVSEPDWIRKLPGQPYRNENDPSEWSVVRTVLERAMKNDTLDPLRVKPLEGWRTGWYKIEFIPDDPSWVQPVTRFVEVSDPGNGRIPENVALFAALLPARIQTGGEAILRTGSGAEGYILAELQTHSRNDRWQWVRTGKKGRMLSWKIDRSWQGGAVIRLVMVRSNRSFTQEIKIPVPYEHSVLSLGGGEWPDRVKPGDSVDLRLKVTDERGQPVRASVGISVYDASLDRIYPHDWPGVSRPVFNGGAAFGSLDPVAESSLPLLEPMVEWVDVTDVEPININWFGLGYYGISRMDGRALKMEMARPQMAADGGRGPQADAAFRAAPDRKDQPVVAPPENQESVASETLLRKDFRETAVFDGNLMTDENGRVSIRFRVPDAFTEWKILATGNDGLAAFGHFERRFRSTQDLMLRPNFPRLMRQGDSVDLAARLGWYGQGTIDVKSSLTLSDSLGRAIGNPGAIPSKLTTGGVSLLTWPFSALSSGTLTYALRSVSNEAEDGLQDTIRIVPDSLLLWNARPFFLAGPGKREVPVGGNPLEAVFDLTTSPVWQVLQSLPVVNRNERDCSEYWFSRLYLACLAGSIADRYPEVASCYLADSAGTGDQERRRQIRDWMDPKKRLIEFAYVLEKLSDLQNQDGTWPWFKGMGTDLFMTQQIISGFGELRSLGVFDITNTQRGKYMLTHSIEAMDNWMTREFRDLKRADSTLSGKVQLNPLLINYLYARSFYPGFSWAPGNEIAWIHYNDRIASEWTQHDPGLQALMAIASFQLGKPFQADPIYRSLRERAKTDDQWGMYWPRKGSGSGWFNWDLLMQARMIELFALNPAGLKDLDQLKIYLLHQKRGRDWGNGLVAAWAARSLLFFGKDSLQIPATVGIVWGKTRIPAEQISAQKTGVTGYFRKQWKTPDPIPSGSPVVITETAGGPSWGTVYTLDRYSVAKLSANGGPLKISRMFWIDSGSGTWVPLTSSQSLSVGRKVRIRLTLTTDRELSYISVSDYLPAGFQPLKVLSGYRYADGLGLYLSRGPESVDFYVAELPKGVRTIEYEAVVEQSGAYSAGYATATSLYAPEFRGWSDSFRIRAER